MSEYASQSLPALHALKGAWRGDWSSFDGRTLRDQLDEWESILILELAGKDVTLEARAFLSSWGICPNGHWTDYCENYGCAHDAE